MLSAAPSPIADHLRQLVSKVQSLRKLLGSSTIVHNQPLHRTACVPTLHLPFPDDVMESIDALCLPRNVSIAVKDRLTARLLGLQQFWLQSYQQICHDIPYDSHQLTKLADLYRAAYKDAFINTVKRFATRIQSSKFFHTRDYERRKPTFNSEYTPLLEKYFEYNAYPAAPDRLVLARKSMMTPRQIEVWFQNHRNRARKEGKILPRLKSDLPLRLSLESLEKMPLFAIEETGKIIDLGNDSSDEKAEADPPQPTLSAELFSSPRPLHAFPSIYRPTSAHNCFPSENRVFKFAPPAWRRRPATSQLQLRPINMDEFIAMFAVKLNLREDSNSNRQKSQIRASCHEPWFAAIVTVAPPAPHPAFIKLLPLSSTSATSPRSPSQGTPKSRRKMTPLPRRTPKGDPVVTTTISPSPSYQASNSRLSSCSSIATSRSRSTSTSSLSSVNLHTPLSSPVIRAQGIVLPYEDPESFDFDKHLSSTTRYPASHFAPLDLDFSSSLTLNHLPPFAQYHAIQNPFISSYLVAQT